MMTVTPRREQACIQLPKRRIYEIIGLRYIVNVIQIIHIRRALENNL
jgi:hypothetical protein